MTAAHPSQPGHVPAHKARLSWFEEQHTKLLQIEAGYLDGQHRAATT